MPKNCDVVSIKKLSQLIGCGLEFTDRHIQSLFNIVNILEMSKNAEYAIAVLDLFKTMLQLRINLIPPNGGNILHFLALVQFDMAIDKMLIVQDRIEDILDLVDNIDKPDLRGRTPLSIAARNSLVMFEILIAEKGSVNVNARDQIGATPLHYAVTHNHKVVRVLLENGAKINAADDEGYTPLHIIATQHTQNAVSVLKRLLLNGAKIHQASKKGVTAFMLADVAGANEIKTILSTYEWDLKSGCMAGNTDLVLVLS